MYKYLILFFSVTLFLCGCKSDSVPDKFIQPNVMAALLVQIHLVDGSLYNGTQVPDSLYKYGMGKYLAVFKKIGVDSAQFRKSLDYYSEEPDKLSAIYDKVDLQIKGLTDSVNLVQTKNRLASQKIDSLRIDSAKKANKKPKTLAQKADSLKELKTRKALYAKRDSIKIKKIKKLKHRSKRNAVPLK
jgi:hypothetical protein